MAEPLVFAIPVLLVWRAGAWHFADAVSVERLSSTIAFPSSQRPHIVVYTFKRSAALPSASQDFRHFYRALFVGDRLEPHRSHNSFVVFYAIGAVDVPRDLPMFYLGYFYMIWWSVAVALIIGALCERTERVQQIWLPYSYLLVIFSGFFFLSDWLPPVIRNIALCQPYTQAYEMIRSGVFGATITTYGHRAYTTFALAILTLFRLWLMRESRKYVVIE